MPPITNDAHVKFLQEHIKEISEGFVLGEPVPIEQIEANEAKFTRSVKEYIDSLAGDDPSQSMSMHNGINAAHCRLVANDQQYREHFEGYVGSCMLSYGAKKVDLGENTALFRRVTTNGSYGTPEEVFESGFIPRILDGSTPRRAQIRSELGYADTIRIGWTKGPLVSMSADLKHAASLDFNVSGPIHAGYLYTIVGGVHYTVASSIYQGASKDFNSGQDLPPEGSSASDEFGAKGLGNPEGAMEYVSAYIRPEEVLCCHEINERGEFVSFHLNPGCPDVERRFATLCQNNLEVQKLIKAQSVDEVKIQHFFDQQMMGETYTQPRKGERMGVSREILGAQLSKERGGSYKEGDKTSEKTRDTVRHLMDVPAGKYDQKKTWKEAIPTREDWNQRVAKNQPMADINNNEPVHNKDGGTWKKLEQNRAQSNRKIGGGLTLL
jgi:hypothetical protein